jgi:hypothetical protein
VSAALRALLAGIVDYAGLFPPASLDATTAARNYHAYRSSPESWMLGRFVVGVAKLPELRATIASLRAKDVPWQISVVAPDAAAATSVLRGPDDANARIESVEVKATTVADVALISRAAPKGREVYVEVPLDASTLALLDAIADAKLRAKVRTGGVSADVFPAGSDVVAFIRACLDLDLPFKATAGLHHPLRGSYRLTYDGGAPVGRMYGYLNVFLAATFMREGLSDKDAVELLEESDSASIAVEDQTIRWRNHAVSTDAIAAVRGRFATSFGSCSFREPVDELPYPVSSPAPA